MAQIYDNILLKIDADLGQSTEKIGQLTEKIEALRKREAEIKAEMAENKEVINEYVKAVDSGAEITQAQADAYETATRRLASQRTELAAVTEARKAHTKEIGEESRKIQNTVIDTVEYENSLKGLASRLSVAKDELRAMNMYLEDGTTIDPLWQEKAKEVNDLNDKVKKAEETYGVFTRNVGNYSNSIIDAFKSVGGAAGRIANNINVASAACKNFSKTGIIPLIALVAQLGLKFADVAMTSEENVTAVNKTKGLWTAIGDKITTSFQNAFSAANTFFEKTQKGWLPLLIAKDKDIATRMLLRENLEERILQKNVRAREVTVQNAQDELQVSELRLKAKQKDLYTAQERLAYLEKAAALEEAISKRNMEVAEMEYEIIKLRNSFSGSSTEELNEEAAAQAKMLAAQKSYSDKVRELQEGIQTAKREMAAEAKALNAETLADEAATAEEARRLADAAIKAVRDAALSGTVDYDKEQVRAKYAELIQQLERDSKMSADEQTYYRVKLKERENAELAAIDKRYLDEKTDAAKQQIADEYAARIRAAEQDYNGGNWKEEHDARISALEGLRDEEVAKQQAVLENEQYTAEQRTAIYQQYADQIAEIDARIAEENANYSAQRIERTQFLCDNIAGLWSTANQIISGIEQRQLQEYEEDNDTKKDALKTRLDAGIINQEQYAAETAKLDEELDKKKAEINRKAAIRERALSVFQIGVNTAAAIMKIWAEVPKFDFGISTGVLTALAAAAGIAQMAAVLAQPLPTARRGGLVQGATHEAGGVLVETEGDERIVSAAPSRAFPELLNLISYIGKHQLPNSGYGVRNTVFAAAAPAGYPDTGRSDYSGLADAIGERITDAIKDVKIYTAITDVKEAEAQYARVVDSAKI